MADTTLSAVSATGAGTTVDQKRELLNHTVVWHTTAGTNITLVVEVSHDGVNWGQANGGTAFYAGSATEGSFTGYAVARYVRANLTSFGGGATLTATIASV